MKIRWIATVLSLVVATGISGAAHALDEVYTGFFSNLAVGGYDPVAYFADGMPLRGSSEHTYDWKGVTWQFAKARNRELFQADPDKYAPAYGGYCAYAVANGATAPGDPEVWRVVDGRLYLNVNRTIQNEWQKDIPGFVRSADANWPQLLQGE